MLRRGALLAATTVAFAACNALTGAGDLEVGASADASVEAAPPVVDDAGPAPLVDDAGPETGTPEAGTPDASPDADAGPCVRASTGLKFGTKADATMSQTGPNWGDLPSALRAFDDAVAHTNGTANGMANTNTLVIHAFTFNLPAGATILGIEVEIRRSAVGNVLDSVISLPKGLAKDNGKWPEADFTGPHVATKYGGPDDTWGAAWTPAELGLSTFGVGVKTQGDGDGHLDSVGVTVHYCARN